MKGTYIGEFEELVLLTVAFLGEEAYAVHIEKGGKKKRYFLVNSTGFRHFTRRSKLR